MRNSINSVAASALFLGLSFFSLNAQAQMPRRVQKPQVPMLPLQSGYQPQPTYQPQGNYQQAYQPQGNYYQPQGNYQQAYQPVYTPQPQMGATCYAGQVMGTLQQYLPIGSSCAVLAYGNTYYGTVGQ
jgi:hypothetical protein